MLMKQELLRGKTMLKFFPFLVFSLLLSLTSIAQKTVSGIVTNGADNQPVADATVRVKGTTIGTFTASNGAYNLSVPAGKVILVVTSVGFDPIEIDATNNTTANATLVVATGSLNEVVVTGYSSQRKKDIIGAVAVVNIEDLK